MSEFPNTKVDHHKKEKTLNLWDSVRPFNWFKVPLDYVQVVVHVVELTWSCSNAIIWTLWSCALIKNKSFNTPGK